MFGELVAEENKGFLFQRFSDAFECFRWHENVQVFRQDSVGYFLLDELDEIPKKICDRLFRSFNEDFFGIASTVFEEKMNVVDIAAGDRSALLETIGQRRQFVGEHGFDRLTGQDPVNIAESPCFIDIGGNRGKGHIYFECIPFAVRRGIFEEVLRNARAFVLYGEAEIGEYFFQTLSHFIKCSLFSAIIKIKINRESIEKPEHGGARATFEGECAREKGIVSDTRKRPIEPSFVARVFGVGELHRILS